MARGSLAQPRAVNSVRPYTRPATGNSIGVPVETREVQEIREHSSGTSLVLAAFARSSAWARWA